MATKLSVDDLLEQIGSLTLLEAADLKKKMEETFGVTAAAPVGVAFAPGAGAPAAVEEKTEFDVILTAVGDKKIEVLKVVREVTGLGLKEAKDVVDSAPKPIKEKCKKEEADQIKAKLEATGAKVEIK
jgi:large subunit ribosomal protein L7/L12